MGKRILPRRAPLGEYITVATRPDGRYFLTLLCRAAGLTVEAL